MQNVHRTFPTPKAPNALELFNFLSQPVLHKVDGGSRWHFYDVDKEKIEADREKLVKVKTVLGT